MPKFCTGAELIRSWMKAMLSAPNTIRGVVFDLDGVLIQSAACHRVAFETVLRSFGVLDFDYSQYAGRRTRDVIDDVFRRAGLATDPDTVTAVAREKTQLAIKLRDAENLLSEECCQVLSQLAVHYRLALA